jgi:hypothetical protein
MAEVFVPLNRFQSIVTGLTGEADEIYTTPEGVSSIVLSCQITNNSLVTQPVTIFVTSNKEIPVPDFSGIYSGSSFISSSVSLLDFSGSFASASFLLNANRQFLRKEIAAYTNNQNNLSETPFTFISSYFEQNTLITQQSEQIKLQKHILIKMEYLRLQKPNILHLYLL